MGEILTWMGATPTGGLVLPAAAAVALSTLGLPWLALAKDRPAGFRALRTRWMLFSWLHPFWAALVRWTATAAVLGAAGLLIITQAVAQAT